MKIRSAYHVRTADKLSTATKTALGSTVCDVYLSLRVVEYIIQGFQSHHVPVHLQRNLPSNVRLSGIVTDASVIIQYSIHRPNL